MSDNLDDLEDEFENTMLVIEENKAGELEVDDPTRKMSDAERIYLLLRALLLELGSDIVVALAACDDSDEEDDE